VLPFPRSFILLQDLSSITRSALTLCNFPRYRNSSPSVAIAISSAPISRNTSRGAERESLFT